MRCQFGLSILASIGMSVVACSDQAPVNPNNGSSSTGNSTGSSATTGSATGGTSAATGSSSATSGSSTSSAASTGSTGGASSSSSTGSAGGASTTGSAGGASGAGGSTGGASGGSTGTAGSGGAGGAGGSGGASGAGGSSGASGAGTGGKAGGTPDAGTMPDASVGNGCEGVLGHPTIPCSTIPAYPGVKLKLVEDFDAPLNLDTDEIWTYSDGFSDQAQARFLKANITFANGSARIALNRGAAPTGPTYAEGNSMAGGYPAPFNYASPNTSGELRTKYNNFKYGYYEFRIKPPVNTTGNFIAAAFVFRTPKWQDWRELDIELQAAGKSRVVPTNVIVGENQGGWSPAISDALDVNVNFDTQAAFHTYGFDWEPGIVNFYIDRATNSTPVRVYRTGMKLPIPNKSAKIMMNFWLFASSALGGGDPANNPPSMTMEVDYVRFYKSDMEPFYPCSPTPACLGDATHREDLDYSKNNSTDGLPTSTSGL